MGILQRLATVVLKSDSSTYSSDEEVLTLDNPSGWSSLLSRDDYSNSQATSTKDSEAWLTQLNTNPRLSGLNKIINDTGTASFGIYYENEYGDHLKLLNHPLESEIKKLTSPRFFSLWATYRYMTGVTYIAYELDSGVPRNFKVFTSIHKENSASDDTYTFRLSTGEVFTYPKSQVIIDFDIDPVNPYRKGFGKAAGIMQEIEADSFVVRYIKQFYYNSAQPNLLIAPRYMQGAALPTVDTIKRLSTMFSQFHKGIDNAHKTAFLTYPAEITALPSNHQEMGLIDTRKFYRDLSLQHFQMPPEINGIIDNSNKATVIAAEHIYARQVRKPLLTHFEDVINSHILPLYTTTLKTKFEFDDILPDDVEENISIAKEGREAKSLTINEHRVLLGKRKFTNEYGNYPVGTIYDPALHGVMGIESQQDYNKTTIQYEELKSQDYEITNGISLDTVIKIKEEENPHE